MAHQGSPQLRSQAHRQTWVVCVCLVAITWLVFGQTVRYDFVNYDDARYRANAPVRTAAQPGGAATLLVIRGPYAI